MSHLKKMNISPKERKADEETIVIPTYTEIMTEINLAAFQMKDEIIETPCEESHLLDNMDIVLYMKQEFRQVTNTFKARGMLYALLKLSDEQKQKGVIMASIGNHALSLCHYGDKLKIPVTVVLPKTTPMTTIIACQKYDSVKVYIEGDNLIESLFIAKEQALAKKLHYIDGYDDLNVIIGQGTLGLEIFNQVHNIDAVVVPCDGGGLLASIALVIKRYKPWVKVYGVEAEKYSSFRNVFNEKEMCKTNIKTNIADELAIPTVGPNSFRILVTTCNYWKELIDGVFTVKDKWIANAIVQLFEKKKYIVDGVGAIGLAFMLSEKLLSELKEKRVIIILANGNINTTILSKYLERGLAYQGHLIRATLQTSELFYSKTEFFELLKMMNISLLKITHEPVWSTSDMFSVDVRIICEIQYPEQVEMLRQVLLQKYKHVNIKYHANCIMPTHYV